MALKKTLVKPVLYEQAQVWVRDILKDGPLPVYVVKQKAKEAGFSESTLLIAARQEGVISRHTGVQGGWRTWSLV